MSEPEKMAIAFDPQRTDSWLRELQQIAIIGLSTSGEGRKQYYLERIAERLGIDLEAHTVRQGDTQTDLPDEW